ncbi:MAG: tRNA pseudouridine(55) synthase TruB [bacterium]|nr:tRNA pseudouridine(55) synthase TruB [bacterium]
MPNIFAVYKPKGPTSNQVLNELRKTFKTKKVGHAGTLDPLAEGVLVVGVGREATKQLATVVQKEKEYIGTVKFGVTSTTDDEEGIKTEFEVGSKKYKKSDIEKIIPAFIGDILQVPPNFSAIKAGGKVAYKVARAGGMPQLGPRQVEIKAIEILEYSWPFLKIRVVTGPGVYIRSLARDLGSELGCGGYLYDLIRTRVGEYRIEDAAQVENIKKAEDNTSAFIH